MVKKIIITKATLKYIEKMSKEDKEFLKTIIQGSVVLNILETIVKQSKKKVD